MADGVLLGLWIFWTIALLVFYHKIFTVYYFSLSNGLMKEFITAVFLGAIMAGLTLYLWYVAAIVIVLFGLSSMAKSNSKTPLIIAIVLAIVIAVLGIRMKGETKANKEAQEQEEQTYQDTDYNYDESSNYVDESNHTEDYDNANESYDETDDYYEEETDYSDEYVDEISLIRNYVPYVDFPYTYVEVFNRYFASAPEWIEGSENDESSVIVIDDGSNTEIYMSIIISEMDDEQDPENHCYWAPVKVYYGDVYYEGEEANSFVYGMFAAYDAGYEDFCDTVFDYYLNEY